eukprot:GHVS01042630.1.p1 GENE.GHVS01042630.1~~GHVS01042630.1.p1  ORF type:complete len:1199 (-),score=206.97 GHVS01042630.1:370-3906(-)
MAHHSRNGVCAEGSCPSISLEHLHNIFERSISSNTSIRTNAEEALLQLRASTLSSTPTTSSLQQTTTSPLIEQLLKFQLYTGASPETKQCAAIYLKNLIRSAWVIDDSEDVVEEQHNNNHNNSSLTNNIIQQVDKDFVKNNILPLLLAVPTLNSTIAKENLVQRQLREALALIADVEFPLKWTDLLVELSRYLSLQPPIELAMHKPTIDQPKGDAQHEGSTTTTTTCASSSSGNGSGSSLLDGSGDSNAAAAGSVVRSLVEYVSVKVLVLEVVFAILCKYKDPTTARLDSDTVQQLSFILSQVTIPFTNLFQMCFNQFNRLLPPTDNCLSSAAANTVDQQKQQQQSSTGQQTTTTGSPVCTPDSIFALLLTADESTSTAAGGRGGGVFVFDTSWDAYFYGWCRCLLLLCKIYRCLNTLDLPEYFEDHLLVFMDLFVNILNWKCDVNYFDRFDILDVDTVHTGGVVEQLKVEVIEIFTLHANKYQQQFEKSVTNSISAVWNLLTCLDRTERNDQLCSSGMLFLSAAANTGWETAGGSPFADENVLRQICSKIIVPNVYLRQSDLEGMEDNPHEFLRRHMEGADTHTRRSAAIDLIRATSKFSSAQLSGILLQFIKALCEAARTSVGHSEQLKDACTALVIGLATHATEAHITQQFVEHYFEIELLKELENQSTDRKLAKSAAMRFVTTFRRVMSSQSLQAVLPLVVSQLAQPDPVVHSYAATCIERLLTVREPLANSSTSASVMRPATVVGSPTKLQPADVKHVLLKSLEPLLLLVRTNRGIRENEYVMKCVMRIFTFLKKESGDAAVSTVEILVQVVKDVATSLSNPTYNHYLFEAIAACLKASAMNNRTSQMESLLVPVLSTLLRQDMHDFIPYCYQILGLLLDTTETVSSSAMYVDLFNFVMRKDCWSQSKANIPGVVRLICAYCRRHQQFGSLLADNTQALLERFQFCLSNVKLSSSAFEIIKAMVRYLPPAYYENHLKVLVTVLLARLNLRNSADLRNDVTVFFALYVCKVPNGERNFLQALESIQAGLTSNVLGFVVVPAATKVQSNHEKKLMIIALSKLVAAVSQDEDLLLKVLDALSKLVCYVPQIETERPSTTAQAEEPEEEANVAFGRDFDVSYAKLAVAEVVARDMMEEVTDVKGVVRESLRPVMKLLEKAAAAGHACGSLLKAFHSN